MRGEGGKQWDLVEDAFVRLVRILYIIIIISYIKYTYRQDQVNNTDSAIIFLVNPWLVRIVKVVRLVRVVQVVQVVKVDQVVSDDQGD